MGNGIGLHLYPQEQEMKRLQWLTILMVTVILVLTAFQVYWLRDNYSRERKAVEGKAQLLFRETRRDVQDSFLQTKLKTVIWDSSTNRSISRTSSFRGNGNVHLPSEPQTTRILQLLGQQLADSARETRPNGKGVFITVKNGAKYQGRDSLGKFRFSLDSIEPEDIREVVVGTNRRARSMVRRRTGQNPSGTIVGVSESVVGDSLKRTTELNTIYFNNDRGDKIVIRIDSLFNDTIPLSIMDSAYKIKLGKEKLDLPFTISRRDDQPRFARFDQTMPGETSPGFEMKLGNIFPYLLGRITLPLLFSLFLVGITIASFLLFYRNIRRQQRLALLKNDLISNITHELKTPIATVGVAIEALKNFNAIQDPQKTKEYLDISQNELQRLGLLVDKVLKLSMFENKKIEIKKEFFDLGNVVEEVVASLRLQAEKYNARIAIEKEGELTIKGDRLHLLSVVFNLLDNALKYSKGNAAIGVEVKQQGDEVMLKVTDNGIGIPAEYKDKIFEKFFRVPSSGDTHNAKGHGLGLSYVAQVIQQHNGRIELLSHEGLGSTFTVTLPKNESA